MTEYQLTYEKLDVYQRAIDFLATSARVIEEMPKGNSVLIDQLKRASLSIVLNIAEGCGKTSQKDNLRFFTIARGSAMECGAILDACRVLGLCTGELNIDGQKLIVRVVAMLSKICR